MLQEILQRKDVLELIEDVCTSSRYNDKNNISSANYELFYGIEQPLFMVVDALYKYKIIIDDVYLLDEYIVALNKLMKKLSNYHDINNGINILLGKMTARKLELSDSSSLENKRLIIKHIYEAYIVNGYMFHGTIDTYKEDIRSNGLRKDISKEEIININNILSNYDNCYKEDSLTNNKTYLTDSFLMAYYYACNGPGYLNKLFNNEASKKQDAYFRKDKEECFKYLKKMLNSYELSDKDSKTIKDYLSKTWDNLSLDKAKPIVVLVKRSLVGRSSLKDYGSIMRGLENSNLEDAINRVINNRYDKDTLNKDITKTNIIELMGYKNLTFTKTYEVDDTIVDDSMVSPSSSLEDSNNRFLLEYGKVSILMLIGALLIALGVTIMIIMMMR